MAKTVDEIFRRDFKKMMNERRNYYGSDARFYINNLPVPTIPSMSVLKNSKSVIVKGITEQYFSKLNGKVAYIFKRQSWEKRLYNSDGEFRKDENGYMTQKITIPRDSIVIGSSINIGVPNTEMVGKIKRKYLPTEGYKYIDYQVINGKTIYFYYIPKSFVYELNLCAMIVSSTAHKRYYWGYKVALQNGTTAFLYVIPFNPRSQRNYRILSVKASTNFKKEFDLLFNHWQTMGASFNSKNLSEDDLRLCYEYMDGVCDADEYEPIGNVISNIDDIEIDV